LTTAADATQRGCGSDAHSPQRRASTEGRTCGGGRHCGTRVALL
jgi:hypothetical protein